MPILLFKLGLDKVGAFLNAVGSRLGWEEVRRIMVSPASILDCSQKDKCLVCARAR